MKYNRKHNLFSIFISIHKQSVYSALLYGLLRSKWQFLWADTHQVGVNRHKIYKNCDIVVLSQYVLSYDWMKCFRHFVNVKFVYEVFELFLSLQFVTTYIEVSVIATTHKVVSSFFLILASRL